MKFNERIVNIIEDHALVVDFLSELAWSIRNGDAPPRHIPSLSDSATMDALGVVCEAILHR